MNEIVLVQVQDLDPQAEDGRDVRDKGASRMLSLETQESNRWSGPLKSKGVLSMQELGVLW